MKRLPISIALAGALALTGCATTLNPAPSAQQVSDQGAVAAAQGIRMVARADAWEGTPANLNNQLTPLRVTITNQSAQPIYVRYNQFRLVSDQGRRYSALPPFAMDGSVRRAIGNPYYRPNAFVYAPHLSPYFPGATMYGGPIVWNTPYWNRFAPVMSAVNLPSEDMLRKALPEGVLQPGGQVSGFLYFEGVGPSVEHVRLLADFESPAGGGQHARLTIPFEVG